MKRAVIFALVSLASAESTFADDTQKACLESALDWHVEAPQKLLRQRGRS